VFDISLLEGLLIIWAVVTGIAMVLVIYRSTLGSQGEDQLYLSEAEVVLEREHQKTLKREKKLAPFLYVLGTLSGVLLLSIVSIWLYQGLLMT
jgi:hypothetical protein